MPADYIPDTGNIIYVTIGEIVNPISTYQVDGMKLTFFAQGKYAIDEYEGPITWELETGGFNFAAVDPGSFIAYFEDNDYTFRFSP